MKRMKDDIVHYEVQLAKLKQKNPCNDEAIKEVETDLGTRRRMLHRQGDSEDMKKIEKEIDLQQVEFDMMETTWKEAQGHPLFVKQMIANVRLGKRFMLYLRPQVVDSVGMIHICVWRVCCMW
ncbi:hypothetical protein GOP47_0012073 [Adiantum capillus-veneris]|uniref:Uncharacterized protein n=1 Tax=Adiantum capillus-veneris TaxID=13818 RepID=A0A9D4UUN4_ADICA|nr:hypothetical protein GOP47_0012073 [Adiantum capillus-veneris]